ncbi:MFS transporter [Paraburkholderia pallida]|uniref:MFS transporter n=1 Tax=Paraburkholderia pallida TaxID=2547399 RepID=A0A4P7DAL6_9BURK|nr:MFS transporter [Paraburkholderia pallida]QBR03964.1 MFS transporter [Paraburkholderia pallida]
MTTRLLSAQKSRSATFIAAGLVWSLGILIVNILPVVFQALHESRGLSDEQLGAIGTAFVLGSGITSAAGPFWVYRLNPRWASVAALLATAAGFAGVAFLSAPSNQVYWWFAIGLANGCVATPAFTALGYGKNPLRAYSLALFVSTAIASVASFTLPLLVARFGDRGLLTALAVLFVLALPLALMLSSVWTNASALPEASAHAPTLPESSITRRVTLASPLLAALAGSIFTGVFMGGIYNFADAIATTVGVQAHAVGLIVAVSLVGALAGALLPSILSERVNSTIVIGGASLVVMSCYLGMMSGSTILFGVAFVIHGGFSTLIYTYYLGVVRRLDFTNRIYVAYPALQSLGLAAGTSFAGMVLARYSPTVLFVVSAALVTATWLCLAIAQWLAAPSRVRRGAMATGS